MRYLIETNSDDAAAWGKTLSDAQNRGELKILEKGDPVEIIKENLHRIKRALETLEKAGISRDVLETYIRTKSGLGLTTVREVLEQQDTFFKKLGIK